MLYLVGCLYYCNRHWAAQNCPLDNGYRSFIAAFTTTCHYTFCLATQIHSTSVTTYFFKKRPAVLKPTCSHFEFLLPFSSSYKNCTCLSHRSHACYMPQSYYYPPLNWWSSSSSALQPFKFGLGISTFSFFQDDLSFIPDPHPGGPGFYFGV